MRQAILAAGLAGLATASPMMQQPRALQARGLSREKRDSLSDEEKDEMADFCNSQNYDLKTSEGADDYWYNTAGGQLDMYVDFVHDKGPNDWLVDFEKFALEKGEDAKDSKIKECGYLDLDCNVHNEYDSCEEYWYAGEKELKTAGWAKNAFWIFEAVKGVHSKLRSVREAFERETLFSSLQIDKMAEDFDSTADDTTGISSWFKASMLMGGALAGLVPGGQYAGMAVGVLNPILGQIGDESEDEVDTADIKSSLGTMGEKFSSVLERNLKAAVGEASDDDDYDRLPAPLHDTLKTDIGKFYNGGFWILDNTSDEWREVLDAVKDNLRRKVAHNVLKSAGWKLVADWEIMTDEECQGRGAGARWKWTGRDDEHACFMLSSGKNVHYGDAAPDELYEKMDSYGLGRLHNFYEALINCAVSDKEDKDLPNTDGDFGETPLCFMNMETKKSVRVKKSNPIGSRVETELLDLWEDA